MSEIRVMWIGTAQSALPEDEVVNTFHFVGAGNYADDVASAFLLLDNFYIGATGQVGIGAVISPWIKRESEYRAYDMSLEKPVGAPKHWRVPTMAPCILPAAGSSSGLPEEVACCITMHGVVPPALSGRRRGRLYIGPLVSTAAEDANNEHQARPQTAFMQLLADAAGRLIAGNTPGPVWSIMSSVPSKNFVRVAAGYVDNAWDTQRRRGPEPTTRIGFGFPGV